MVIGLSGGCSSTFAVAHVSEAAGTVIFTHAQSDFLLLWMF